MREMSTETIGELKVRRLVVEGEKAANTDGKPPLTVVLMHGFGAPGDDLVGLAPALKLPPGSTVIFPEAPVALSEMGGLAMYSEARAWWLIDIVALQRSVMRGEMRDLTKDVPKGLAEAREKVNAMLDELAPERLIIGGFSQGSMLATDVTLRGDRKIEGLVILSGTLLAEDEWVPRMPSRKGLRVFQSHGTSDELLPFSIAKRLEKSMIDAGMTVSFSGFEGGHGIPPQAMRDLNAFLAGF